MNPFETCFPKQAQNIKKCTQLSAKQKRDFFDTMEHIGGDEKVIREASEKYFRQSGRKLRGSKVKLYKNTRLGRMHQWENIEALLEVCKKNNGDYGPAGFPIIKGWRDRFSTGDPKIKRNVLEEVLEVLGDFDAPSPWVIWAFLFNETDRPFVEENLLGLPCRLGLDNTAPNDYFPLELEPSPQAGARKSTAFDAELDEHWCPGGWTCPRVECSDKKGLKEVVMGGYARDASPDGLNLWHAAKAPTFMKLALVK